MDADRQQYRYIETHPDEDARLLPVLDTEHFAPDEKTYRDLLEKALSDNDSGIQLGSAFTRPMKAAQPIPTDRVWLSEPGVSHISPYGKVENHRYLAVEGSDSAPRFGGEVFEKGAWLGGRRSPNEYKRVHVAFDSGRRHMWLYTTDQNGNEVGRVQLPFPQDLEGEDATLRLFDQTLRATRVMDSAVDELLSTHFGRPIQLMRVDEKIVAGDPAMPDGVTTAVWGNDGAPLHILSKESLELAEARAVEQRGEERAAKLPHRPWRPDLVIQGARHPLVPHLEDEIALWAVQVDGGGHAFIQTVRQTPRCAGMQGYYGVVGKYRPKEPRDRRDGKAFGQQRPLFGVNANVWTTSLNAHNGEIPVGAIMIPLAARRPFKERWEGRWME